MTDLSFTSSWCPEVPAPSDVINLMDALRESTKHKKASNSGRSTNRRESRQRNPKKDSKAENQLGRVLINEHQLKPGIN